MKTLLHLSLVALLATASGAYAQALGGPIPSPAAETNPPTSTNGTALSTSKEAETPGTALANTSLQPTAGPGAETSITNTAANGPTTSGTNTSGATGILVDQNQFIPGNVTNTTYNPDELHLNFRNAPLEMVLNYLSDAAGFTIVLEARPAGRVDVWSTQPLTRNEAVDLLNTVLNRNGFAAIRRGRTLTIVNRDEAKIRAIPVKTGSNPEEIPDNDEMVTQILPVRYVEVAQLIKDIQPLVSVQTAMTANESGNSIVITDTQANIRRVAEVIRAIDMGAEDLTVMRVFKLTYADPSEMADLLTNLFPDESRSGGGGNQSPIQFGRMFGGRGGGGNPFGGGNGQASSGSQSQRIKKRARVLAVPDARTASVIVSAARDLIDQIEGVVQELDTDPRGKKTVKVFKLQNSDPTEAMQVLQDIFQKNGTTSSRNNANQTSVLQNRSNQQNQQNNVGNNRGATGRSTGTRSGGMSGGFGFGN